MAVGMNTKAIGQHDEFASLSQDGNHKKTQKQLYWAESHFNYFDVFPALRVDQRNTYQCVL